MTVPLEVDPAAWTGDGAKLSVHSWAFPLHDQPYPTIGADGRVVVPAADQVR